MKQTEHSVVISVVIPCYNQAAYLPEALDSLLSQTYPYWEAIVVNDGYPDETEGVARDYARRDDRISYVYKENGGAGSARNYGIALAKGEYILPLDADDVICPEYMELAMKIFEKQPQTRLVYCQGCFFGEKEGLWELAYQGYRKLLICNSIFVSAFFRKTDWEKTGGYDEMMRNGYEDWEYLIRLLDEDSIVCQIPLPLFCYRIKKHSLNTLAVQSRIYKDTEFYIYTKNRAVYDKVFDASVLDMFRDREKLAEKWDRRMQKKWYKRFFHEYIKRDWK